MPGAGKGPERRPYSQKAWYTGYTGIDFSNRQPLAKHEKKAPDVIEYLECPPPSPEQQQNFRVLNRIMDQLAGKNMEADH